MKLLIAGASGFIGKALVKALEINHEITVLGRDHQRLEKLFSKPVSLCTWESLANLDAKRFDGIINLCGYNISDSRWTAKVKQLIIDSRVETSRKLIDWAKSQEAKPHFYCANAVGIYGMQENGDPHAFDEDTPIDFSHPRDFLSQIGVAWQEALQPALDYGMKVTTTRFGVVLQRGEGMLKKLAPSFKLGLGSILADGKQVISWIAINDLIAAFLFLLARPELTGAFNLTAPTPVDQAHFAKSLAQAMHRPLLLKTPGFVIRSLFGEMGECLILRGQRVIPKRLLEEGYQFLYPTLTDALEHEFY